MMVIYCTYLSSRSSSFFLTDTAPSQLYTLSLHDALPISLRLYLVKEIPFGGDGDFTWERYDERYNVEIAIRSEEHTSELQSHHDLVCRLLLEKKKKQRERSLSVSIE